MSQSCFMVSLILDTCTPRIPCNMLSNFSFRTQISSSFLIQSQVRRDHKLIRSPSQIHLSVFLHIILLHTFTTQQITFFSFIHTFFHFTFWIMSQMPLFPSGTTWMQEIVTLVSSRGDPHRSQTVPNWARAPWLEQYYSAAVLEASCTSPRIITTHLPHHLLGPALHGSKAKVRLT